jgi:hypothetical protein
LASNSLELEKGILWQSVDHLASARVINQVGVLVVVVASLVISQVEVPVVAVVSLAANLVVDSLVEAVVSLVADREAATWPRWLKFRNT